jgi:hypothetical protein
MSLRTTVLALALTTASAAFSLADYAKDPAKYKGLLDESSQGRRQLTGACAGTYGTTCPVGYVFEEKNVVVAQGGFAPGNHAEGPNTWKRLTGDWHLTYGMPDKSIDSCGKICDTDTGDAANCRAIEYNESPNCGSGDACSSGASQDCYLLKSTLTTANQGTMDVSQSVMYTPVAGSAQPQSPGTIACIKDSCASNCMSAGSWAPPAYECACSCPVELPYTPMDNCTADATGQTELNLYDDRAGCCEDLDDAAVETFLSGLTASAIQEGCAYHGFS